MSSHCELDVFSDVDDIRQVLHRAEQAMANGVDPDPADLERIETFLRAIVEMEKANALH